MLIAHDWFWEEITAEQIAQLSRGMTLYPGDIILTGTPAGVGLARNEFLKAGDTVRIEIEPSAAGEWQPEHAAAPAGTGDCACTGPASMKTSGAA